MHDGCMRPYQKRFFGSPERTTFVYMVNTAFLYSILDVYACLCKVGEIIIPFPVDFQRGDQCLDFMIVSF